MQGIMPEEICWRVTKEPFSPDYHDRYNRDIERIKQLVAELETHALVREIIDIDKLKQHLTYTMHSNRCYDKNDFIGMHMVPQAIYLATFLASFTEATKV